MTDSWEHRARRRRAVLLTLTFIPSAAAAATMHSILPAWEGAALNALIALLFALLFAWVSMGFWSAITGLFVILRKGDRFTVASGLPEFDDAAPLDANARAAILFPLYNENAARAAEGVRVVWRSLQETGQGENFDIFILSDSTSPDAWVNEEIAWHALCEEENAHGRIFYRRRAINRKGKSGNIADFCRRWGADYPYMIVFDADSLMSGGTLVRLVRAMEERPDIGIIQTTPKSVNSESLIARVQQFSNHLYGPVFAAGLHYWQLGDAQYWGHNAILRTEQFIRHCHLPVLPGAKPLGGPILSHDFVEAALMRRAGYGVWLAYELPGSYEENPPSLIDELVRDRRWCQGNLQHGRLVFARGFFPTHRALFINGILSYVSALLWFFFLLASSAQAAAALFRLPVYFPEGPALFPNWPQYFSGWMLALFGGTTTLLFLPKFLAVLLVLARGNARGNAKGNAKEKGENGNTIEGADAFGGRAALLASALGELLISALLAPVRMLYHSLFVITTLLGFTVRWNTQNRDSNGTTWRQAIRFHWWGVLLGVGWGGAAALLNPEFFLWLSPIIIGLAASIPLSVWTSRTSLGRAATRLGLFLTPAETAPPPALKALSDRMTELPDSTADGFRKAVVMPGVLKLHLSLSRAPKPESREQAAALDALVDKALHSGPRSLTSREKTILLRSPRRLASLHAQVWSLEDATAWGITR